MIPKIYIMHEYGAPRHFLALYHLQKEGFIDEIQSMEFDIFRQIVKSIMHLDRKRMFRCFSNIVMLYKLFSLKGQIIIVGAAPLDPIIFLIQKLKRKNKIIYFTSWPFWNGIRWVKKPLLKKQKKDWCNFLEGSVSVGVTEDACEGVRYHGSQPFHIPHSVDTKIFKPSFIKSEKTIVLFVGSLIYRKGISILIDVVKNTKWPHNTEFWFVGDGPFRSQIISMEKEYPVKYIEHISNVQELTLIYQEANIFVLPSIDGEDIENFGIVLIEAMASGLPIITTDCVGPKEVIDNGYDGYLISQKSKEQLREKLIYLINNPDLRIEMGRNGRKIAEDIYSVETISERWKEVINFIVEAKR